MIQPNVRVLVLAVAAALVVGPAAEAVAKKPKRIISATIDGKRLKPTKRTVYLSAGGGTIGFLASAQKIRIRGTTKTLMVSCAVLLAGRTFPFTSTDCLVTYGETKGVSQKFWSHVVIDGSTSVTFDSYDGTNIAGSFQSVVPPGPGNSAPPVSVVGTFRGVAEQGDPNR